MGVKPMYLLQYRYLYEKTYRHLAFGDHIKQLVDSYINFDDKSIDSYIITDFKTKKVVYHYFQENRLFKEIS